MFVVFDPWICWIHMALDYETSRCHLANDDWSIQGMIWATWRRYCHSDARCAWLTKIRMCLPTGPNNLDLTPTANWPGPSALTDFYSITWFLGTSSQVFIEHSEKYLHSPQTKQRLVRTNPSGPPWPRLFIHTYEIWWPRDSGDFQSRSGATLHDAESFVDLPLLLYLMHLWLLGYMFDSAPTIWSAFYGSACDAPSPLPTPNSIAPTDVTIRMLRTRKPMAPGGLSDLTCLVYITPGWNRASRVERSHCTDCGIYRLYESGYKVIVCPTSRAKYMRRSSVAYHFNASSWPRSHQNKVLIYRPPTPPTKYSWLLLCHACKWWTNQKADDGVTESTMSYKITLIQVVANFRIHLPYYSHDRARHH